jgi:type II secretory pathway component PulC
MYIAADNSFVENKKHGVAKSLKSGSFHEKVRESIKLGMRPYLNEKKRVERQNKNGSTEILKMKNMEPVWVAVAVVVEEVAIIAPKLSKKLKGISTSLNERDCIVILIKKGHDNRNQKRTKGKKPRRSRKDGIRDIRW